MEIYLVSLKDDVKRREELKKRFPKYYDSFKVIDAVDGRKLSAKEYFQKTAHFVKYYNRMMSPSELGCSLSHFNIFADFLSSSEEFALVLEDDVIGTDNDIDKIIKISKLLNENALLICGCQDGLGSVDFLYGKKNLNEQFWELSNFSYEYVLRTASYLVTKNSAKAILDYQNKEIMLADNWDKFFVNTPIKIYFTDIFAHPVELGNSHIEADRVIFREETKTFFQKLFSKEVFMYIFRKLKINLNILMLKLAGYEKVIMMGKR